MEKSLSQKIVKNTIYNIVGRFWGILVVLVLTPYIIRHIGVERYGVWAIVGVLTGYFGLLDFGIGTSFVKYIAEYYAKKDYDKINQVINTGFLFYTIFAFLIIGLGFIFINPLLNLFNIPTSLYQEARFVFILGIIIFSISNALSPFGAVQGGLQRMDISNRINIILSLPNIAGTVFFLEKGYGLPGLIINNAIILVLICVVNIIIAHRILPELRFSPFLFTKEMFKRLFGFGYKLQIAMISSMISVHIDKLLISHFLSIGLVTFFQLGSSIVETAKSISVLFLTALIPAFSEIDAKGEKEKLIDGYLRGTKYLMLIVVPLFSLVIISASQIMMAWMGVGYEKSGWIIQILGIGWFWALLTGMRAVIVQAIAKPEIEMKAGLIAAILNIPLSIIFIIKFGFVGVAFGTSVALFFSALYGLLRLHQELRISFVVFIKASYLKIIIPCLCISLPLYFLVKTFQGLLFEPSRITSLLVLIIQSALFLGIYLKVLSYIKPLDKTDITLLFKDKFPVIQRLAMRFSK